ncbi:hypothetical protein GCM10027596_40600 [Nocardioides korecus]
MQEGILDVSSLPATLLFGATGLAVLRTSGTPQWFGWFSLVGVPFILVDASSYDGGPLEIAGLLGLIYFLLWALPAGYLLHRSPANTAPVRGRGIRGPRDNSEDPRGRADEARTR